MCNIGDIILVSNYKSNGRNVSRHSFVVIDNEANQIRGLDYDIMCNAMSSFKGKEQKEQKLRFPGNFCVNHDDSIIVNNNKKDGYIKSE